MKQREKKTNNNNKNDQIQKYDVRHVETSENTHRMRARVSELRPGGKVRTKTYYITNVV